MKKLHHSLILLMVCPLLMLALSLGVFAADPVLKMNVNCKYQKHPLTSVTVDIYRLADISASGGITPTKTFAGYPLDFDCKSVSDKRGLAYAAKGYITADKISPYMSTKTDSAGTAAFPVPGASLEKGMYLICPKSFVNQKCLYLAEPFIVELPPIGYDVKDAFTLEINNSKWIRRGPGVGPAVADLTVEKDWEDENSSSRPKDVTVELYKNGVLHDTVTLNEKNGWKYCWKNLPTDVEWIAVEKPVPGYQVKVEPVHPSSIVFRITNTGSRQNPPPTPPPGPNPPPKPNPPPAKPPVTPPTTPVTPPTTSVQPPTTPVQPPQNPVPPSVTPTPVPPWKPDIPQTGTSWWAVPILAAAGMLCVISGTFLLRR